MVYHPLTNYEIQKYYQNKPKLTAFIQKVTYVK